LNLGGDQDRGDCRLNYEQSLEAGDRIEVGVSTDVFREREPRLNVQLWHDRS
jgi:hypothetical protein